MTRPTPHKLLTAARPLTMDEAAATLGVSRRWLQDFLPKTDVRYLVAGRKKLFDDRAMNELREAIRRKTAKASTVQRKTFLPDGDSPAHSALRAAILSNRQDKAGIVYFIQCLEFVKIGFTNDLEKRANELQTASPIELVILKYVHAGSHLEAQLHSIFQEHHVRGEWFRLTGNLATFIEGLP